MAGGGGGGGAGWMSAWPGSGTNSSSSSSVLTLLNETSAAWADPNGGLGANLTQYLAGAGNGSRGAFHQHPRHHHHSGTEQEAMKQKNWPALLILIIIFLTIGGNILVILAVSLEKKLQNATNFFLRSLAVADMLVGILVMPISLINILYDYAWPFPNALCPIWIYLDVLFSTASIMHLCAISLDRYVAIRNPIEHSRFNSRTKAMMKIAVVWTISIGISMPIPVIGLHNQDKVFVNGTCVMNEERFMLIGSFVAFFIPLVIMVVTYCLTIQVLQRQATVFLHDGKKNASTTTTTTTTSSTSSHQPLQPPPLAGDPPATPIPTVAVTTASSSPPSTSTSRRSSLNCLRRASSSSSSRRHHAPCSDTISIIPSSEAPSQLNSPAAGAGRERRLSTGGGAGGGSGSGCRGMMQAIKNERRASKVLGVVFFLFLVMWCPFFITNVLYVLCRQSCDGALLAELLNVFVWVGYISSGVNPLVYTLFNKTYRRAFSSYLRCRYRTSPANGVVVLGGASCGGGGAKNITPSLHVVTACSPSSHATTPIFAGRKSGMTKEEVIGGDLDGDGGCAVVVVVGVGAVDRNSNCKNGDGSVLKGLELDDSVETDTEMGMRASSSGLLSVNSCFTSAEDTSSV
ncbi:5-hydroxytryptamine (serotonin) receptor 2C, G protein-coupled-like 1 [Engraulis encrasicolus]|uniref:5-hydroxytryptamine (serotonin) receptor 2C, G protein-coupled-like 1 n=1 Tax=Engraulis encrasicolus TaxID=184585 RepID=UPI002FCF624F